MEDGEGEDAIRDDDGAADAQVEGITRGELRARRRKLDLSQGALAHALGVSRNTIARWERGELAIGNPILLSLALEHLHGAGRATRGAPRSPRVRRPILPRRFPPPHNLPSAPTPLIGREGEVETIRRRLLDEEVRLLTLTGPGGSGKTRLALAAAEGLLDAFPAGVFFVDLSPALEADLVVSAIAGNLGLRDAGQLSLFESLRRHLQHLQMLLVLDNFEQVLEAAPLVGELLGSCPRLKVLITSREPLRLRWEHVSPVRPLEVPDVGDIPGPEAVDKMPALALFVERTRALRPDFELTAENLAAVAEVCIGLEGLPLSIELAAARGRHLTPQAMVSRLRPRLELLRGGARDQPARHRSLREAIDWSYELLDPLQRAMFRRLGVFVGGTTMEAAAVVSGVDSSPCLDALGALVDKSLLRQECHDDREPRLAMLETIREYALEQLAANGELEDTQRKHAGYYLEVAEEAEQRYFGPGLVAALDRLEREHDNLRAALRWAIDRGNGDTAVRLVAALGEFWWIRGYVGEGLRWIEQALSLQSEKSPARARALNRAGVLATCRFDLQRSTECFAESVTVCRETGEEGVLARVVCQQGCLAALQGDVRRGWALLEESLAIARQAGHRPSLAYVIRQLGLVARGRGDLKQAAAYAEECLALFREVGDPRGTAYALLDLGEVALDEGDVSQALEWCQEALALFRQVRELFGTRWVLATLARAAWLRGEPERTALLAGIVDGLTEVTGIVQPPGWPGDYERAVAAAKGALDPAVFEVARAEGRAMPLEVALDYAVAVGETGLRASAEPAEALPGRQDSLTSPEREVAALADRAHPNGLTSREVEVLQLIAAGRTSKEIAAELMVSPTTVQRHIANIYVKINAHGRVEATAYALRHGLT